MQHNTLGGSPGKAAEERILCNMTRWTKPQLIVLARGTPEESVLVGCKVNNPKASPFVPEGTQVQAACALAD